MANEKASIESIIHPPLFILPPDHVVIVCDVVLSRTKAKVVLLISLYLSGQCQCGICSSKKDEHGETHEDPVTSALNKVNADVQSWRHASLSSSPFAPTQLLFKLAHTIITDL